MGTLAGVEVAVASPQGYALEQDLSLPEGAAGSLSMHSDPLRAVAGACAVYTVVWVSMGDEPSAEERSAALDEYRLDDALLDVAAPGAFAIHDLPAHPGAAIPAEGLSVAHHLIWELAANHLN